MELEIMAKHCLRIQLASLLLTGLQVSICLSQENPTPKDKSFHMRPVKALGYQEEPLPYNEVRPQGFWKERIERSLDRLIASRESLCEYFGFGADQAGRWVGTTSVLAAVSGKSYKEVIEAKVQRHK